MLEPGQKVNLTYYEGERQIESYNWIVEEYDNGLLKVSRPAGELTVVFEAPDGAKSETSTKWEATKPVIFNLRSIGFLKVELAE